jgi:predicted nucleotidyltransferase
MTQFEELLKRLVAADIRFVLVGGLAAVAHGSAYVTIDLDICYQRSPDNIKRLVSLLNKLHTSLRDAPKDLPFVLDEKTFSLGMNFTFDTDLGALDLLGEISGVGTYPEVEKLSEPLDLFGFRVDILSLEGLIKSKQAAGRPKDEAVLKELRVIQEMKKGS